MESQTKNIPALRFPEFSEDWDEKKLADVTIKVGSGSTPTGGANVYGNSGILFIRSQNVNENRLKLEDVVFISEKINSKMRGSIVEANDILLNITGASIGRSCVVPKSFKTGNVNQHVCIIRLDKENSPRFLQLFISSEKGQKLVSEGQTGGGREGLNFHSIRGFKIFLPNLPEQQKIAAFLSAVDDKIEQLSRTKGLLTKYKKGVMQQIFDQKIRFKDDAGDYFSDWEKKELGKVCKVFDGTHMTPDYKDKGIPFYSVEHLTANNFTETKFISEEVFEKENNRVKLEKGDILMTRIGDIGTSKYISWSVKASFYVSLALIKQSSLINALFLNQYISSSAFQHELHKRTIHVAFPKKINLGEISNCEIVVPSPQEQQKIADFLTAIDKKIDLVNKQLEKTKTFKKGLLQKMFV